ncbi:MAG: alpha/beta fold hydrolase [Verrucomicrobia bacterium]|nr:alpha/beta fold hydrolase [Verrucomicrobiota bacterium]
MKTATPITAPHRPAPSFKRLRRGTLLALTLGMLTAGFAKADWNGYEQINFNVDGRGALLVVPKNPAPGKHWIWRTEFFGIDPQVDIALLGEGVYVGYIGVGGLFGAPVALDAMDKYYDYVRKEFGLNAKTVVEGFSRGGLYALNWAIRHPDRVACMYLDAPVCDFKSWPGGGGRVPMSGRDWRDCLSAYQMTDAQARAYKGNPIDNLEPLAKAKIPIFCVCGDMHDWVVPIEANTLLLEERYKALGGDVQVIRKPKAGHRPHSLPDPTPIVNFVLKHTTGGQMPEGKWAATEDRKALAAQQTIDSIPLGAKPDQTHALQSFRTPAEIGDNYGARVHGFVHPSVSGDYTFAIAGDDETKLFLSTDQDPKNRTLIASSPEWTEAANFRKFPSQMSKPIRLEAGRNYYIAAIHKENTGGDNLSVAWTPPGVTTLTVIPGANLSPYPTGANGTITHEVWTDPASWPERRNK